MASVSNRALPLLLTLLNAWLRLTCHTVRLTMTMDTRQRKCSTTALRITTRCHRRLRTTGVKLPQLSLRGFSVACLSSYTRPDGSCLLAPGSRLSSPWFTSNLWTGAPSGFLGSWLVWFLSLLQDQASTLSFTGNIRSQKVSRMRTHRRRDGCLPLPGLY